MHAYLTKARDKVLAFFILYDKIKPVLTMNKGSYMSIASWRSYPKIWTLGHPYLKDLFKGEVIIEEKVDGSQFSFGVFNGELRCRSKGVELVVDAPEKLFIKAVEAAKALAPTLTDGYTYRAEYLNKSKHNVLQYTSVPPHHLIVFDIATGAETFLNYEDKKAECDRLGLMTVPLLHKGEVTDLDMFKALIDRKSCLGGATIEGCVVKNYAQFGIDKRTLLGKYVSEDFKEVHKKEWRRTNPHSGDIETALCEQYRSKARWLKAIQHLRDQGVLTQSPKDIGALVKEVQQDLSAEAEAEIKEQLYKWILPKIKRKAVFGLPEWYKEWLLKEQFEVVEGSPS